MLFQGSLRRVRLDYLSMQYMPRSNGPRQSTSLSCLVRRLGDHASACELREMLAIVNEESGNDYQPGMLVPNF